MAIRLAAGSDSGLRLRRLLRDVRALRWESDDDAALPQILDCPPHRADRHAERLGELPLTFEPRPWRKLPGSDPGRDVVRDLLPHVHGPGRIHRTLIITHMWNVGSHTAPRVPR